MTESTVATLAHQAFLEHLAPAAVVVKTIETYRSNIKTKLNLRDAAALVRYAATWIERL